jgi:hypothetical protein
MRSLSFFLLAFLSLLPAGAQSGAPQASIASPVLGFAYDAGPRAIRPILGMPGASIVGDPLDLGVSVATAAISPRRDFAILVGADDAAVRVLSLQPGDPGSHMLPLAVTGPGRIIFSPDGGTVGLYQQDSAKLQIFTHMPQEPVLAHEINTVSLAGDPLATALSDDGEMALILTGSTVWLSRAGADPVQIQVPPSTSAMVFRSGGYDALMATRDGQVYLLQDLSTGTNLRTLLPPDSRTSDPVAVQFSPDGTRAYVATRQGTVAGFGIQTEWAAFTSCGCSPSGLFPLHSRTLIRLNEISDGPLMLLDTADPEFRIWFVPAVIPATGSERGAQ